jgi:hypothetical protein
MFLHDLLQYDPEKRISINDLVNHPYLDIPMERLEPIRHNPKFNQLDNALVNRH